ncbi:MAG: hypothetical protein GY953_23590, partial [bacterium]|nr:hypothetical protein [bacterium]
TLSIEGQRYLSSPVKALVVLEALRQAPRVFAGTRDGEVLCLELDPMMQAWRRTKWVYQVRRGVAGLSIGLGVEKRIAVLSTGGEVVLMSPGGLRIHRYRAPDTTMAAVLLSFPAATSPDCLVVGAESGKMTLLQETPESAMSLEMAVASLEKLVHDPHGQDRLFHLATAPFELRDVAEPQP